MKKLTYILIISCYCFIEVKAQINLVPNPSFESYTICPNSQGQAKYAIGWENSGPSSDYFNSCAATFTDFGVPINWGGYQPAASGNAYCGIGTYVTNTFVINGREYIGAKLLSSLNVGTKYFVALKVNLCLSNSLQVNCATKNIGVMFTKQQVNFPVIITTNYNPQISYNSFITDTVSWTQIFGSFIADSAYQNLVIGNFKDDNNTDTLIMNNWNTCSAYYYIDDVCVSTDSIFTKNYFVTGFDKTIKSKRDLNIYPNPSVDLVNIDSDEDIEQIKIYNLIGKLVLLKENTNKIFIDNLNNGIYIIEVLSKNKVKYKQKIIKL